MSAHYSIIKFLNSHITGECVAIGLVIVQPNRETFFAISDNKLKIAQHMNPKAFQLLEFACNQFIASPSIKDINLTELRRMHVYNNGILAFSSPSFLNDTIETNDKFMDIFNRWIECVK